MQDILSILHSLRRPRLLIRAARFGAEDYRREKHLARILGEAPPQRTGAAVMKLLEIESELESARRGVARSG